MVANAGFFTRGKLATAGKQLNLFRLTVHVNAKAGLPQVALDVPLQFHLHLTIELDAFRNVERQVAQQQRLAITSPGAWSNSAQLQIIERRDDVANVVCIRFFRFFVEAGKRPRIGRLLAGQRDLRNLFDTAIRILFDGSHFEIHEIVLLSLQQVVLDPVAEFRGEFDVQCGDVRFVFLRVTDVVVTADISNLNGFVGFVLVIFLSFEVDDFFSDDQVGDNDAVLFDRATLVKSDSAAVTFENLGVLFERIDHSETDMIRRQPAAERSASRADQRSRRCGESFFTIGGILVVIRKPPDAVGVFDNERFLNVTLFRVINNDPQSRCFGRLQFGEEFLTDQAEPLDRGWLRGPPRDEGEQHRANGTSKITSSCFCLTHRHSPELRGFSVKATHSMTQRRRDSSMSLRSAASRIVSTRTPSRMDGMGGRITAHILIWPSSSLIWRCSRASSCSSFCFLI